MIKHIPPKLPLNLFRLYCSDERLEELEGDLYEVYQERISEKGTRFSKLFYWWLVVRSFRSFALKRTKMKDKNQFLSIASLLHNVKIAWRSLLKRKMTTSVNVLGLAVGVSGFIAIYSIIAFELSFNTHFTDRDRIYRVYSQFEGSYNGTNGGTATAVPLYLREHVDAIDVLVRFHTLSADVEIPAGNESVKFDRVRKIALVDSAYFEVFDQYSWLAGSSKTALAEAGRLVLTKTQGEKYFGQISPLDMIGRRVVYQDSLDLLVSGIVESNTDRTDFEFTDFISFESTKTSWLKEEFAENDWGSINSSWQTFVRLPASLTPDLIDNLLDGLNKEAAKHEEDPEWITTYTLQSLDDLHFNATINIFDYSRPAASLKTLRILLGVAIALLVIAIFNFINLETAQAINQSKEVGLRKSMGISKTALIGRFLTESVLVASLAVLLSLPLVKLGLNLFTEIVPEGFAMEWSNPAFWMFLFFLMLIVGFLAGIYPAFIASSYSPVEALKSSLRFSGKRGGSQNVRKVLITSQFVFSQLLVILTVAILWQLSFMLNKEMGFQEQGVIYFRTPFRDSVEKQQVLLNEIRTIPSILASSYHNSPPARDGWNTSHIEYFNNDSTVMTQEVHQRKGDVNYLDVYHLELVVGRNIDEKSDGRETLINETYSRILGFNHPHEAIGIELRGNGGNKSYKVVGVLKDYHFQSLHTEIKPMMYSFDLKYSRNIGLRVNTNDIQTVVNEVSDRWEKVYPDNSLKISFMDETIKNFYITEKRTSKIASLATGIAILISCLGLFGLISFTVIQKSKELGVRKVLGASMIQIGSVISREFFMLIVIALIISTPASYYLISKWMEDFAYQTTISWWIYALGGLISIVVALASIGTKVWKASVANPVDSLKYE